MSTAGSRILASHRAAQGVGQRLEQRGMTLRQHDAEIVERPPEFVGLHDAGLSELRAQSVQRQHDLLGLGLHRNKAHTGLLARRPAHILARSNCKRRAAIGLHFDPVQMKHLLGDVNGNDETLHDGRRFDVERRGQSGTTRSAVQAAARRRPYHLINERYAPIDDVREANRMLKSAKSRCTVMDRRFCPLSRPPFAFKKYLWHGYPTASSR